jgi:hypothetical protein
MKCSTLSKVCFGIILSFALALPTYTYSRSAFILQQQQKLTATAVAKHGIRLTTTGARKVSVVRAGFTNRVRTLGGKTGVGVVAMPAPAPAAAAFAVAPTAASVTKAAAPKISVSGFGLKAMGARVGLTKAATAK